MRLSAEASAEVGEKARKPSRFPPGPPPQAAAQLPMRGLDSDDDEGPVTLR